MELKKPKTHDKVFKVHLWNNKVAIYTKQTSGVLWT